MKFEIGQKVQTIDSCRIGEVTDIDISTNPYQVDCRVNFEDNHTCIWFPGSKLRPYPPKKKKKKITSAPLRKFKIGDRVISLISGKPGTVIYIHDEKNHRPYLVLRDRKSQIYKTTTKRTITWHVENKLQFEDPMKEERYWASKNCKTINLSIQLLKCAILTDDYQRALKMVNDAIKNLETMLP